MRQSGIFVGLRGFIATILAYEILCLSGISRLSAQALHENEAIKMKKAVQVKIALSFHMILAAMGLLIWPGLTTAETAIIAHRGGRGLMPDNTLDAFAEALGVGVTALHV